MAEIGSVKATFTASASGLVGAVNESVSSLNGLKSAQASAASGMAASTAAMRDAAKIAREMRTPAEQYASTVAKLDSYLARGLLTQEVYSRAIAKAKTEFDSATRAADQAASGMTRFASAAQTAERIINGLTTVVRGVAGAVSSVADAGQSIIALGIDIAKVTATWKIFNAVTSAFRTPEGIFGIVVGLGQALAVIRVAEAGFRAVGIEVGGAADFASKAALAFGAYKVLLASGVTSSSVASVGAQLNTTLGITRTLNAVMARLGVSAAATSAALGGMGAVGAALGGILARVAAMSIPGFGQLAAAVYLGVQAIGSARDTAYETAAAVAALSEEGRKLGATFQDMQIQKALDAGTAREDILQLGVALSALDARQFDDLALAAEHSAEASTRLGTALGSVGTTLSSTFTGLFAGASEGAAALTNGLADIVGGINAIATPVVGVIQPFVTLIGAVVQGVAQLGGALMSVVGLALRFGGVLLQIAASPFIVGLNNFADTIRAGIGGAFEYVSGIISSLQKRLDALQNWLSKIPVIGGAFASNEGGVAARPANPAESTQGAADAAAAAKAAMEEETAAIKSVNDAIAQQELALSSAIDAAAGLGQQGFDAAVAYQTELRSLNDQLQAGILNETSYAQAAGKAKAEFDSQVAAIKERNKAVADINAEIEKSATAGKNLGAAADGVRAQFKTVAANIRRELESGIIGPEEAKKRMASAVDAMNDELGRLGDDIKFAERIRDQMKTAGQKVAEELAAIDANQTLTADEKLKAKAQVKEKAAAGLPGGGGDDPISKFREQQKALNNALKNGVIGQQEFNQRQATIRSELDASVADFRDQQGRNAGPDRRSNTAAEVNSSEGVATFFRILRGSDDPTAKQIAEAQRQTRLLERVNEALSDNRPVQI